MKYTPPTPEDLKALRDSLGLTQGQMADFVQVAGGQQWRKYTGGEKPRKMNLHMLFYIAAKLELSEEELDRIYKRMVDIGAVIE